MAIAWKRGFYRALIVLSILWILLVVGFYVNGIRDQERFWRWFLEQEGWLELGKVALVPPLLGIALLEVASWIARGFYKTN